MRGSDIDLGSALRGWPVGKGSAVRSSARAPYVDQDERRGGIASPALNTSGGERRFAGTAIAQTPASEILCRHQTDAAFEEMPLKVTNRSRHRVFARHEKEASVLDHASMDVCPVGIIFDRQKGVQEKRQLTERTVRWPRLGHSDQFFEADHEIFASCFGHGKALAKA